MKAMVLHRVGEPLQLEEVAIPEPNKHQVLIKISSCGVCRTDLHIFDGELSSPKLPLILGHQIIGHIVKCGSHVTDYPCNSRVGVPWLGSSCRQCEYCLSGKENLCNLAQYTGYHIDGGYAEYCVADSHYIFPIPANYPDLQAAPLMCAGLVGYRALRMTEGAKRIGFYGFGASAHLLAQVVTYRGGEVYAFTHKPEFAKKMGAVWTGKLKEHPPQLLDAAILFAPVGELIPIALQAVKKGGIVVCAGIHMSDIPSFPYKFLWEERMIRSVANLTRADGEEFLALAPKIPILTETLTYTLEQANEALTELKSGHIAGAAVILV